MNLISENPDKLDVLTITNCPYLNGQTVGMVRYNTSLRSLEVCDSYGSWHSIMNDTFKITMQPKLTRVLDWAYDKMIEESTVLALAEKNKSVAVALENLNKAKEQLALTTLLSTEEKTL